MRRLRATLGAAGVVFVVLAAGASACTAGYISRSVATTAPHVKDKAKDKDSEKAEQKTRVAAERFLDRYVDLDGRVVRRDQGGDTVSEGQAYAMLLAVAVGDQVRFARVWNWTADNLQRPDGLLAWHWTKGRVRGRQSATDADLDAARALALAGKRFAMPAYVDEARRIGAGILSRETTTAGGRPVLVAGPWARGASGAPVTLNPSYVSPRAYQELLTATGDEQWQTLADVGTADVRWLTTNGLPPDWAVVDGEGAARPTSSPGGAPPGYGFDAVRVPVRFGEACSQAGRAVAAGLWSRLRGQERPKHAVGLVGAAGAATAAGDRIARDRLLDDAERRDSQQPTYYGAAWVALGRVMLTTDLLGSCSR